MARTRAFDREEKLNQAMQLFWEQGYEATSIQQLVERMGINRFSIYNTYGDKQALFQQVLEAYQEDVFNALMAPLQTNPLAPASTTVADHGAKHNSGTTPFKKSGKQRLTRFFRQLEKRLAGKIGKLGCLIQITSTEPAATAAAAGQHKQAFGIQHTLILKALTDAKNEGEIHRDDLEACTRHLLVTIQGLLTLRRAGAGNAFISQQVTFIIDEINRW